jgi:hypothetical protein
VSVAHIAVVPQVALVQALHALLAPPSPWPAQHARQNAVGPFADSSVQTLQLLQTSETVQGSPGSPRGVQVPPVHV